VPRGVWGLWNELSEVTREGLREIYCEIREEHGGLTSRLAKRYAKTACEIWYVTDCVSEEAAKLAGARKSGRGRRPTSQTVRLLAKRQAMQTAALDSVLAKLNALVAKDRAKTLARLPQRVG